MSNPKFQIFRLSVFWFFSLMAISGCFLGFLFYIAEPHLPLGAWHHLATPPSKAIKILSQRFPYVYVQTLDDNIYACENGDKCKQVNQSQQEIKETRCGPPNSIAPFPPSTIVDSLTYRSCGVDGYADVHIIILDDGSIWRWITGWSAFGLEIIIPTYSLCGALLGILVGFVIYKTKRHRLGREKQ